MNGKRIDFIGDSPATKSVRQQIQMVASSDATVLLIGETGSGKEVAAALIHQLSPRSQKPFVGVNCAGITETLAEAELFGHEKGAFTGATTQRRGHFEEASQGTIFLDEIGEMPLNIQPKLLRVLQEQEFQRLGSSRTIPTDARLIAATNRDLEELSRRGAFRCDLYYRLNVFPIRIPPLRERRDDIPLLIRYFTTGKGIEVADETLTTLMSYSWPGNIRELRNVLQRAVIVAGKRPRILPEDILLGRDAKFRSGENDYTVTHFDTPGFSLEAYLAQIERDALQKALLEANGNRTVAASLLGMKRTTLIARLKVHGLM